MSKDEDKEDAAPITPRVSMRAHPYLKKASFRPTPGAISSPAKASPPSLETKMDAVAGQVDKLSALLEIAIPKLDFADKLTKDLFAEEIPLRLKKLEEAFNEQSTSFVALEKTIHNHLQQSTQQQSQILDLLERWKKAEKPDTSYRMATEPEEDL